MLQCTRSVQVTGLLSQALCRPLSSLVLPAPPSSSFFNHRIYMLPSSGHSTPPLPGSCCCGATPGPDPVPLALTGLLCPLWDPNPLILASCPLVHLCVPIMPCSQGSTSDDTNCSLWQHQVQCLIGDRNSFNVLEQMKGRVRLEREVTTFSHLPYVCTGKGKLEEAPSGYPSIFSHFR